MPFKRYRGRTLPEIIFTDPDYFYWALEKLDGKLALEAEEIASLASRIKIPGKSPERFVVEYRSEDDGKQGKSDLRITSTFAAFANSIRICGMTGAKRRPSGECSSCSI
jgi:hypothetical protein